MLTFSKYQGLGNDFILMDGRTGQLSAAIHSPERSWVQRICDRRFGIGGDGLILALPPEAEGELRRRIAAALLQLPEDQREVFLLRERAGLEFRQIAEVTGEKLATVRSRMRYALEGLRRRLSEDLLSCPEGPHD